MNKRLTTALRVLGYVFTGITLTVSVLLWVAAIWAKKNFNVGLQEILFTLNSPLKGANTNIVVECIKECTLSAVVVACFYIFLAILDAQLKTHIYISVTTKRNTSCFNIRKFFRKATAFVTVITFMAGLVYAERQYQILDFVKQRMDTTKIYEDYYIHPDNIDIRADGDEKNLICIYLESMETTYASIEDGGCQSINYIPNLTRLANENISFSNTDKLGGFCTPIGTTWTMSALMSSTAGIPFAFPTESNSMNLHEAFADKLINLGDILDQFGYNQYFLCGSDAEYGGRKAYFEQHGNYKIIDLYVAREKGYIPKDYCVSWGFEDFHLYDIAKKEITNAYNTGKPFNFTMLTVDTHFPDGFICELCTSDYDSIAANAISCADKQLNEFLTWCQTQPFFENTAIVIMGDHLRMDTPLVENVDAAKRMVYNCFVNCGETSDLITDNRLFTSLDIFPTTLSAMGFEYDGNRIGLGTNLFSGKPTLAEQLGIDYINSEFIKYSQYYIDNFS